MSANRIQMNIEGNLGYGPDQINNPVTLADLLAEIEEAIVEWGEDAEVVLNQTNNGRGANYGRLSAYELFEGPEDDRDN